MAIDECLHTFNELSQSILPKHLKALRQAMKEPVRAANFSSPGIGPVAIAKAMGLPADFSGCYLFIDRDVPIYVGISRGVLARLRQHVFGKTHFDASLAYRMARHHRPTMSNRSGAMQEEAFRKEFEKQQKRLRAMNVAYVAIENPLELYLFEPFAAMAFETSTWNTFKTH